MGAGSYHWAADSYHCCTLMGINAADRHSGYADQVVGIPSSPPGSPATRGPSPAASISSGRGAFFDGRVASSRERWTQGRRRPTAPALACRRPERAVQATATLKRRQAAGSQRVGGNTPWSRWRLLTDRSDQSTPSRSWPLLATGWSQRGNVREGPACRPRTWQRQSVPQSAGGRARSAGLMNIGCRQTQGDRLCAHLRPATAACRSDRGSKRHGLCQVLGVPEILRRKGR